MNSAEKLNICKQCPLWKETENGPICDPGKWINSDGKLSLFPRKGYTKGCGCLLNRKTLDPNSHCVVNKW